MSGVFTLSAQIPVTLFECEIHNKAVLTLCQIENGLRSFCGTKIGANFGDLAAITSVKGAAILVEVRNLI